MNTDVALYWVQHSLEVVILISAPILGIALIIGLFVSFFQAVTSMQEMTLSYIPKIAAVAILLFFLSPWMLQLLIDFTTQVFLYIPNVSN